MCFLFQTFSTFQFLYPRGIARGLIAGVAQPDVETISNQSGDTFLLSDVDTDLPSVSENPNLELSSEPQTAEQQVVSCLLYTSPSPRDATLSRMPSSA